MYEQHFGLKKRPFRAKAAGADVFVGPNIAAAMAGIKKALATTDAVIAVSGPVGSGKTTLVNRALEAVSDNSRIVHISRMRLDSNDILEFLLDELDVSNIPNGSVQKFTAFRRRLKELQDAATQVLISIEDAVRLGTDTLAEIEALSSADAGESDGAALILMGDEQLQQLLADGALTRLQQRLHQRRSVPPLCAAELRGYLRHCFRLAGGDFEQLFEPNAAELLHHVSQGVPRVVNSLVESALRTAAEQGTPTVSSTLVARIAENEFGLRAAGFDLVTPAATEPANMPTPPVEAAADDAPEDASDNLPSDLPTEQPAHAEDDQLAAIEAPAPAGQPATLAPTLPIEEPLIAEFADVVSSGEADTDEDEYEDIPELIQDTLPDLEVLAPELTASHEPEAVELPTLQLDPVPEEKPQPSATPDVAAKPAGTAMPQPAPEPAPATMTEPVVAQQPVAEPQVANVQPRETETPAVQDHAGDLPAGTDSTEQDVPAWDRDPTLAELRPDLDALELAMAHTMSNEPEPPPVAIPTKTAKPQAPQKIPEITLDHAISQRIEDNLIDEPGEVSRPRPAEPVSAADSSANSSSDGNAELAVELPKKPPKKADAELEHIAAELAKAKSIEDVDDRMAETLFGEELSFAAAQVLANPPSHLSANDANEEIAVGEPEVAAGTPESDMEVTLQAPRQLDNSGMDLSASQRLKTVRALNADLHPSLREPETTNRKTPPPAPTSKPESIEDQINTSMTQTLKALNVRPPINDDNNDEEERRGFFSRFKRS